MDKTKYDKLKEFSPSSLLNCLSENTLETVYKEVMMEMFLEELAYIIYDAGVTYPDGRGGKALVHYDEDRVREHLTKLIDDLG